MAEQVGIAFAFAYIGDAFHGSQIQPEIRTVQRDLLTAFYKAKFAGKTPELRLSSRTDGGVNARMNVGRCIVEKAVWEKMGEKRFLRAVNDHLDDAIIWAATETAVDWNPRIAERRVYRYRFEALLQFTNTYDEKQMLEAMKLFEGAHDFTGFSRPETGRMTKRKVDYCTPWYIDGRLVGFEIAAQSFLWNQVRRIAWTLGCIAIGDCTLEDIRVALETGEEPPMYGLGMANWLTLWRIDYENLTFTENTDDLFSQLEAPPEGLSIRQFELWQQSADFQQKQLLISSWLPVL
ncbi:MAG: hypothetical protein HOE69_02015 [Euryarchaeota archaeon]|jgi:tRNA pseudouridine38-40 synthase|nr:hypothetical protein [Euryarchaeota archaeon]